MPVSGTTVAVIGVILGRTFVADAIASPPVTATKDIPDGPWICGIFPFTVTQYLKELLPVPVVKL